MVLIFYGRNSIFDGLEYLTSISDADNNDLFGNENCSIHINISLKVKNKHFEIDNSPEKIFKEDYNNLLMNANSNNKDCILQLAIHCVKTESKDYLKKINKKLEKNRSCIKKKNSCFETYAIIQSSIDKNLIKKIFSSLTHISNASSKLDEIACLCQSPSNEKQVENNKKCSCLIKVLSSKNIQHTNSSIKKFKSGDSLLNSFVSEYELITELKQPYKKVYSFSPKLNSCNKLNVNEATDKISVSQKSYCVVF